jgi:hypothetical protein
LADLRSLEEVCIVKIFLKLILKMPIYIKHEYL